jgi:hypothetical protein
VLDSIELVQTAISGMLAELRAEVKALETGESGASRNVPSTRPQVLGPDKDQRAAKEPPEKPSQPRIAAPEPAASAPVEAQPDREPAPREERKPQPQPATAQQPPSPPATTQQPAQPATAQQPAQPAQPATAQPQPTAGAQQQRVSEPAGGQPSSAAPPAANEEKPGPLIDRAAVETKAQPDRKSDSSAEFDQMIHGEIRRMFHSGKSREDVESFLARFELGDNYLGLLDELYSQKDPTGRRRIFGRRRDR